MNLLYRLRLLLLLVAVGGLGGLVAVIGVRVLGLLLDGIRLSVIVPVVLASAVVLFRLRVALALSLSPFNFSPPLSPSPVSLYTLPTLVISASPRDFLNLLNLLFLPGFSFLPLLVT